MKSIKCLNKFTLLRVKSKDFMSSRVHSPRDIPCALSTSVLLQTLFCSWR